MLLRVWSRPRRQFLRTGGGRGGRAVRGVLLEAMLTVAVNPRSLSLFSRELIPFCALLGGGGRAKGPGAMRTSTPGFEITSGCGAVCRIRVGGVG